MLHSLSIIMCLLGTSDGLDTRFAQVYPLPKVKEAMERTPTQHRAVLLIAGLRMHSFSAAKVHQAQFHDWQSPSSHLVQVLGKNADVFAFAYAQNVPVDVIAQHASLAENIQKLRRMGYEEIILLGHSAGGIVARNFVEENPNSGVTRVVQVCAPNLGSSWAKADVTVRRDQEPFMHSLTKEERLKSCQRRQDRRIPPNVQFLCVVGSTGNLGDGIVSISSQWPEDLQAQGIPAARLSTTHFFAVRSAGSAARIADLTFQFSPRWSAEELTQRRKAILAP
jgi:pimeloyl-ACP methyl ester carboxylesterase